jgi:hypothetical protein
MCDDFDFGPDGGGDADIVIFDGRRRRCPRHGQVICSDDGMFDGVCGGCEYEMSDSYAEEVSEFGHALSDAERMEIVAKRADELRAMARAADADDGDVPF